MIIIPPLEITEARLKGTSAASAPLWTPEFPHPLDQVVRVGIQAYRSLIADNAGFYPPDKPLQWLSLGTDNAWAAFDSSPASVTLGPLNAPLEYELEPGVRTTAIALLNVRASEVEFEVVDLSGNATTPLFQKTFTTAASRGTYWSWCFDPLEQQRALTVFSIAPALNTRVRIRLTPYGDRASLGQLVIGRQHTLGAAQYGFQSVIELRGKSYLDKDDNPVRPERGYRKSGGGTIVVPTRDFNRTLNLLSDNVGKPMVWSLDPSLGDYRNATLFGDFERIAATIDNVVDFSLALDINGYY